MPTLRPAAAFLSLAVVALVGSSFPSVAAASSGSTSETAYPLTTNLNVPQRARMVYANGDLFVSDGHDGSAVEVYSTGGQLVHTITGEPGATGMVLSADGSTLYVAQATGNKISAINTSTFAHTEFTVGPCPTYVALAAGRLFFSAGCNSGQYTSVVSSIDPSSGGTPVPALNGQVSPPLLVGGGTTLAVASPDLSPTPLATYTSDDAGTLTELNHITDSDEINDAAMTSDGSTLYTAGPAGTQFKAYDTATLEPVGEFTATESPSAVALSPNGQDVAGGLRSSNGLVNLYDTGTLAPLWERYGASTTPSSWSTGEEMDQALPGSLTFSTNGSHVYGLVAQENTDGVELFSSTLSPAAPAIHLTVAHAAKHRITATAHVPAGGKVVFTGTANGAPTTFGRATANGNGVATRTFKSPYSSSVQVAFLGSDSKFPATATRSFTMPSSSSVTLTGFYRHKHGVKLYHRRQDVNGVVAVGPVVSGRPVSMTLEARTHGKWHYVSGFSGTLGPAGTGNVIMRRASRHVVLRFTLHFKGDSFNTGSHAKSKPFEIK